MKHLHNHIKTGKGYRKYETPRELILAAIEYFEWCDKTPLQEEEVYCYQGEIIRADKDKMRPYTRKGLATFLSMPESRLEAYRARNDEEWVDAVALIEQIIYTQKFEASAVGLMNATIISRDLGLAEKQEIGGFGGGPVTFNLMPVTSGTFLAPDTTPTVEPEDEE